MASFKVFALLVICLIELVFASPLPEPGHKHTHYIIKVPYHIKYIHHHHVEKVPVYIKTTHHHYHGGDNGDGGFGGGAGGAGGLGGHPWDWD